MAMNKYALALSAAAALICAGTAAQAQTAPATSTTATTAPTSTTTATSTTKLNSGETKISLSLAKAALVKLGITNPTPEQITAALKGGTVTTATGPVTMTGVLTQRASGKGWGQIANEMGVKLGTLVRSDKAGEKHEDAGHASGEKHEKKETEKSSSHDKKSEHASSSHSSEHSSGGHSGGGKSGGGGNGGGGRSK